MARHTFTRIGLVLLALAAAQARAAVVINEVYMAGGTTGSAYSSDYVELFNAGIAPVNLSGVRVEYFSQTNTSTTATSSLALGNLTMQPGDYLLIAGGNTGPGGALPAGALASSFSFGSTGGGLRLVDGNTSDVLDGVGYGTVSPSSVTIEGSPTTAADGMHSISRTPEGLDTNNNSFDFQVQNPTPIHTVVPEPAGCAVLAMVLIVATRRARRAD